MTILRTMRNFSSMNIAASIILFVAAIFIDEKFRIVRKIVILKGVYSI